MKIYNLGKGNLNCFIITERERETEIEREFSVILPLN